LNATQVTPVVLIGPESEDFFALPRKAQVRSNDGENALFRQYGQKMRRDYVYAGEG